MVLLRARAHEKPRFWAQSPIADRAVSAGEARRALGALGGGKTGQRSWCAYAARGLIRNQDDRSAGKDDNPAGAMMVLHRRMARIGGRASLVPRDVLLHVGRRLA